MAAILALTSCLQGLGELACTARVWGPLEHLACFASASLQNTSQFRAGLQVCTAGLQLRYSGGEVMMFVPANSVSGLRALQDGLRVQASHSVVGARPSLVLC